VRVNLSQIEGGTLNDEDERLAEVWLAHFGSPMPIFGAAAVARRILLDNGGREALRAADIALAEDGRRNTPAVRPSRPRR